MRVETLQNGQIEVTSGNLKLVQTIIKGTRFNECMVRQADYWEDVSQHDARFKPLFIALHNYKNNLKIIGSKLSSVDASTYLSTIKLKQSLSNTPTPWNSILTQATK